MDIRKTKSGVPALGIVAKASGSPTTLIDCCPLIIVPQKKIMKNVKKDGIGSAANVVGNELMTPVSRTMSLKIITQIVVKMSWLSNAEKIIGLSSSHLNFSIRILVTIAIPTAM